jgi:hypothetical protein
MTPIFADGKGNLPQSSQGPQRGERFRKQQVNGESLAAKMRKRHKTENRILLPQMTPIFADGEGQFYRSGS